MAWIGWIAASLGVLVVLAWVRTQLQRAPALPPADDAFRVEPRFVPTAGSPIPFAQVVAGMEGAVAVVTAREGWALLLNMNSAGTMSPCSDPVRIVPGAAVAIPAYADRPEGPHRFRILPSDPHEQPVGGGTILAVLATVSRSSLERYVEHHRRWHAHWPLDDLPQAARIDLVAPG